MKKNVLMLCCLVSLSFANEAKDIVSSVCSTCHGKSMERSGYGVSRIPNSLDSSTILNSLNGYKKGSLNMYGLGSVMAKQAALLSNEEIKSLALYIPTLKK